MKLYINFIKHQVELESYVKRTQGWDVNIVIDSKFYTEKYKALY